MSAQHQKASLGFLHSLWDSGSFVGLTDGQLLERFASGGNENRQIAFAALVERHGPMVLRTCRAILRNDHDAEDVFQATFLILARKSGTLWVRDSIAPWLHRVACRAGRKAMRGLERQRSVEVAAAEAARSRDSALAINELEGVVHQELDGLPERYRFPVLLCDVEGRTYEEAARHLGCPVGTVKSRLARGRQRLRGRLQRRGLAPALIGPGAAVDFSARPAVPAALVQSTIDAAMNAAACPAVSSLALDTMKSMLMTKLKTAAAIVLAAAVLLAGIAIGGGRAGSQAPVPAAAQNQPQRSEPKKETPTAQQTQYSWQRTDRYEPPDFEKFFPKDSPDARDLTPLWESGELQKKSRDEIMKLMRASLRATTENRDEILHWFGDKFIWERCTPGSRSDRNHVPRVRLPGALCSRDGIPSRV